MFEGTRLFYKILYFVTAMSPAYILFLLQVQSKYSQFSLNKNKTLIIVLLIFILLTLGWLLKKLLILQYKKGTNERVINNKEDFYKVRNKNGSIISFLLGNILPSVIIIENNLLFCMMFFILLQYLIYKLVINSSDLFPNIVLILFNMDIIKTEKGKYVLVFYKRKVDYPIIYHIGDPIKSQLYITAEERE